jgi:hypothetical protein
MRFNYIKNYFYSPGTSLSHVTLAFVIAIAASSSCLAHEDIKLQLQPKVCTLTANAKQCETIVTARWSAPQKESLCLVIAERPGIKRCWENHADGEYSIQLEFDNDLLFQLRDVNLEQVLASQTLKVIREAIEYRRKRRQPWNILY